MIKSLISRAKNILFEYMNNEQITTDINMNNQS